MSNKAEFQIKASVHHNRNSCLFKLANSSVHACSFIRFQLMPRYIYCISSKSHTTDNERSCKPSLSYICYKSSDIWQCVFILVQLFARYDGPIILVSSESKFDEGMFLWSRGDTVGPIFSYTFYLKTLGQLYYS